MNMMYRFLDIICTLVCVVALVLLWKDRTDLTAAIILIVAVIVKALYEEVEYHG